MASTTFTSGTVVTADWLNDVNKATYGTTPLTADADIWPDITPEVEMHRTRGRLFVFDAIEFTGNFNGSQGGFIPTQADGHNWAIRDSMLLAASRRGLMAVTGYASNEDMDTSVGQPDETIGVSGFGKGVQPNLPTWGGYFDLQFDDGNYGFGIEIGVKNKSGRDETSTPYFATTGTFGIWLQAGAGKNAGTGGSPTGPCNTAILIGKNGQTWNKGIVFLKDGLTGADGTTGIATAIEMAKGQTITWRAPGNLTGFTVYSSVDAASSSVQLVASNNAASIIGHSGGTMFQTTHAANAVNFLRASNATTGNPATLNAVGSDTNVDLMFIPQGTGVLRFGTHTSTSDTAISGYITIKDAGGVTRKLAVIT